MRLRMLSKSVNLRGKRVLVRIDANVPLEHGKVVDGPHGKIARAAVDLEWLRQHGAKIIVLSHLGRPKGRHATAYSLRPVARRLSELLGVKVGFLKDMVGPKVGKLVAHMEDGDILLLENVRFDSREERNSPSLARAWAQFADIYVNDAFAVSHRAHASVDAITSELPSYAGPLLANEVSVLSKLLKNPKRPFVMVMGGLKMKDKVPVIQRWIKQTDRILVGGALANCFLKAAGWDIGKSVYDDEGVFAARKLLRSAKKKLLLPVDVMVASSVRSGAAVRHVGLSEIGARDHIVDVGKRSMRMFLREVEKAKMVVWNGPIGMCEIQTFCSGTELLARGIAARAEKAVTVVGGGDTGPVVESLGLADRFTLLATGGGAMLEFLAGKDLPGLQVLEQ